MLMRFLRERYLNQSAIQFMLLMTWGAIVLPAFPDLAKEMHARRLLVPALVLAQFNWLCIGGWAVWLVIGRG